MRVLITGSTQGIGKALAKAFVKLGNEVIIHGSNDIDKAERVCAEVGASKAVVCDFSNMKEVEKLYNMTGAVDCLILNASVQKKQEWTEVTDETFDMQFTVNVKSTLKLIQAYYPAMKQKHWGRIITIGSVNQHRQHTQLPVYSATKCAVMKFVEVIAKQVAQFGVTVNNVSPGAIATPRNEEIFNDELKRKEVEKVIHIGRFGQADDIVGIVTMLCSDHGSYITGADIVIDGGMKL